MGDEAPECFICLEGGGDLLCTGCACRGSAGRAHVRCLIAATDGDKFERWYECLTCKQYFTGPVAIAMAQAHFDRVRDRPARDSERLSAANSLGNSLLARAVSTKDSHAESSKKDLTDALLLLKDVLRVSLGST